MGSGDRSERIRTYNFPQNRVTDHRIDLTLYKLDLVLQGDLAEIVEALKAKRPGVCLEGRPAMTVREALLDGASVLSGTGSESPYLDASLLLSLAAGRSRESLLASYPEILSPQVESLFRCLVTRRASGESVAYILGEKEFFGRIFRVDPGVLVPRPDTETLVEAALEAARIIADRHRSRTDGETGSFPAAAGSFAGLRVHDAFAGSGCVGITLAAELPGADLSLSDLSPEAREIAASNARRLLGRDLAILESDSLASVDGTFDLITANPPYVRTSETDRILGLSISSRTVAGQACRSLEPRMALDGGADGLDLLPAAGAGIGKTACPGRRSWR